MIIESTSLPPVLSLEGMFYDRIFTVKKLSKNKKRGRYTRFYAPRYSIRMLSYVPYGYKIVSSRLVENKERKESFKLMLTKPVPLFFSKIHSVNRIPAASSTVMSMRRYKKPQMMGQ